LIFFVVVVVSLLHRPSEFEESVAFLKLDNKEKSSDNKECPSLKLPIEPCDSFIIHPFIFHPFILPALCSFSQCCRVGTGSLW
jgi:hypothetical protein